MMDITEQKRISEELTNAKLHAENAMNSKQQFLSNMSHEIRTPMNSIVGFTKILLKTNLNDIQKEYLHAIKTSSEVLIVLINDILDLAKVDAGKMVFEKRNFKLDESISTIIHLFEHKAREKNLKLTKEYNKKIPVQIKGDSSRLHQIILNLLSNAVKFTNEGSIMLSVDLLDEDDEKVTIEFSIEDTGIGIPEDRIDKIFHNFEQGSASTQRVYGGTGLGLAISKQLVELQGGSISVKSVLGKGSTFRFILNFEIAGDTIEIEADSKEFAAEIKSLNVLVVEDVLLNQLLLKTILNDFGFKYDVADNGITAIDKLQSNTYDIILMDLMMPEMNGFEATEYMRNTMNLTIPIIALTADVTTVDVAKCKSVGMNDYIAKPVDENLLYTKIIGFVQKPLIVAVETEEIEVQKTIKYTDLDYLIRRTKSNPILMMEMISLYLEQTPSLITIMKQSWKEKNWTSLYASVHKMIPSFAIMGISTDFENMAKKVQDFAKCQEQADGISEMVIQIETVCNQACIELEEEFITIKNMKK